MSAIRSLREEPAFTMLAVVGFFLLSVWIISSHMEARTYSDLTGKKVGTWDAMWVDLRVVEPAR